MSFFKRPLLPEGELFFLNAEGEDLHCEDS